MSSPVIGVTTSITIREAAKRMRAQNVGSLPVFRDERLIGIVTDRDIVLCELGAPRAMLNSDTAVTDIMSGDLITCSVEDDVVGAAELMCEQQVRRLLVFDGLGTLVGILSLGDVAEHVSEELAGQALGEISEGRARDARR